MPRPRLPGLLHADPRINPLPRINHDGPRILSDYDRHAILHQVELAVPALANRRAQASVQQIAQAHRNKLRGVAQYGCRRILALGKPCGWINSHANAAAWNAWRRRRVIGDGHAELVRMSAERAGNFTDLRGFAKRWINGRHVDAHRHAPKVGGKLNRLMHGMHGAIGIGRFQEVSRRNPQVKTCDGKFAVAQGRQQIAPSRAVQIARPQSRLRCAQLNRSKP